MNKKFEKNRLDLAYQRQLTQLNASLLLITTGILSFIGTFIWNKDFIFYGFVLLIIIAIIFIFWYKRINENLKELSNKISKLAY